MSTAETSGIRQRRKGSASGRSPTNSVTSTSSSEGEKIHIRAPPQLKDKSLSKKLFSSKEERTSLIPHIHKILGFSCLASFAYRLAHLGQADGNFWPTNGTLFFVLHHWLLNASSFIFVIPKKRIQDGGYRIWPENRFHALVFASRHLAFILLRWYEQTRYLHPASKRNLWYMDIIIVLATCVFADIGSYIHRDNHSNTIRDATFSDPFEQWFASQMQLYLTAFCLVGYRRYTIHLVALFVIQVNAFLMTLRRKNVASHFVLVTVYTMLLLFAFFAVGMDDSYSRRVGVAGTFGGVATILRLGPLHVNKYLMWSGLGLAWWYIRTNHVFSFYNDWFWLKSTCITLVTCTLLAWHKRSKQPPASRSTVVGYLVLAFHIIIFSWLYVLNFVWRV